LVVARDGFDRLERFLDAVPTSVPGMSMPAPKGALSVEGVLAQAPVTRKAILQDVTFALPAGEVLAVIGPSGSGKSSLARLLVGVWPTVAGSVRLDGVDVFTWNKAELGPFLGYLPQDIELFDGTLAENIARFGKVDSDKVEQAARLAGLHEMILALPAGYNTQMGDDGCVFSGGQRQRIALARAVYGNPMLVVLDEPNSSLDEAGDRALMETMQALKARGCTIVVISHRMSIFPIVDRVLLLMNGRLAMYGPRDQVLAKLAGNNAPAAPAESARQEISAQQAALAAPEGVTA
jgi:ATP-binding cassette, subfamily C, bacterial exporter for protease/lipase